MTTDLTKLIEDCRTCRHDTCVKSAEALSSLIAERDWLRERNSELEESWSYIYKWVERGMFSDKISPTEAMECIAYHPTAPWQNGRWDVDHKPYAEKLYAKFPKAQGDKQG